MFGLTAREPHRAWEAAGTGMLHHLRAGNAGGGLAAFDGRRYPSVPACDFLADSGSAGTDSRRSSPDAEISLGTLYKLVKKGKIPAFRIGTDWRFNREVIEKWMQQGEHNS